MFLGQGGRSVVVGGYGVLVLVVLGAGLLFLVLPFSRHAAAKNNGNHVTKTTFPLPVIYRQT
jgi:hypothetical protein